MLPVYVIVVNYKRWQDAMECLESLFRSSYQNFSVIVIDNDSQNNSIACLNEWVDKNNEASTRPIDYALYDVADIASLNNPSSFPRLAFIQSDRNAGFAAGNNIALRLLQNENAYFWLVNPDITVQADTLEELSRYAAQRSTSAIIGGVIKSLSGNHQLLFYGGATINFMTSTITIEKRISPSPRLDYIHGACFFAHTSNLKSVGLLPEKYFLYWEESDWCYRAKRTGCDFYVCATAICYDKISTVIGRGFMADYYYVRNGLLFISKYRKQNLPFVLFFNVLRFFKRIFTGQWERARGVLRGTIDFFKMKSHAAE
jgi:GT2 family glycosyltransferase